MRNWNHIILAQFQQIEAVNNKPNIEDIDKVLFSVCILFGMTEYQLDKTPPLKAAKLIKQVEKIFAKPFNPAPKKRIGKYWMQFDPAKLRFGQYIELAYFLREEKNQNNAIKNAHLVLASIANNWRGKNVTSDHRKKAEYFLKRPISEITGSLSLIIERLKLFNAEYRNLFGLDKEVHGDDVQDDLFNKRYGWTYSASQIADYEKVTLDEAYSLPIRQVFNDLAYLKAKSKYEHEQFNKKK